MSGENGSSKSMALPEGVELGNYRLLSKIGQGGFGITYLAEHLQTGEQVVVKENLPTFYATRSEATLQVYPLDVEDAEENYNHTRMRFVQEARLLARLNHPNIVHVSEAFEALGTAYYVMPLIKGKELHKSLPPVVTEEWLRPILCGVLSALEYLHGQKLLHRDIKPGNILLQEDGTPILIDFGTARSQQTERSATMIGTPGYTPIEQVTTHGKRGPWTDIYALGATCYRLITGVRPPDSVDLVADETLYRPLSTRPDLQNRFSQTLLQSIDKAMSVRAVNRWQRASEWAQALEDCAPVLPVSASGKTKRSKLPILLGVLVLLLLPAAYGVYTFLLSDAAEEVAVPSISPERAEAELMAAEEEARQAQEDERAAAEKKAQAQAKRKARDEAKRRAEEKALTPARVAASQKYVQALLSSYAQTSPSHKKQLPQPESAEVVETLKVLAQQGYYSEQWAFGVLLEFGVGMTRNAESAVKWYRKSAEQGFAAAQYSLGTCYESGAGVDKHEAEAAKWYRKAAEQENAHAQYRLGLCYGYALGVSPDAAQAVRWILKAAEQGHARAQCNIAMRYQYGVDVQQNAAVSLRWFRKAAEQGDPEAQFYLGSYYEHGIGISANLTEAVKWYQKAARSGDESARSNLKRLGKSW